MDNKQRDIQKKNYTKMKERYTYSNDNRLGISNDP